MKKRFTEEQIVAILREAEVGCLRKLEKENVQNVRIIAII
jgi:hypothetical protein